MFVQTRTEVRTSHPLYIENPTHNIIVFRKPGFNFGVTTQAERVKVVALNNGKVSVKGIGKGGFPAIHMSVNTRVMVEGERSISLADFLWLYTNRENGMSLAVIIP